MVKKIIFLLFITISMLYSKVNKPQTEEIVVGENHLKLSLEVWNAQVDGDIENLTSTTNIKDDLGFEKKSITTFGGELSTNFVWLPDIKIDYFILDSTKNYDVKGTKTIKTASFSGSTTTNIKYSELNSRFYGYVKNQYFKFDLGINLKKVDYTQKITNNTNDDYVIIKGPSSLMYLPYVGITLDLGGLKINANSSILAFGDDEAKDYEYSISLTTFKAIELFGGYRYHEWKNKDKDDSTQHYKVSIDGGYFGLKLVF